MQTDAPDLNTEAALQTFIVENYHGTYNAPVQAGHAVGLLPDDRVGVHMCFQCFIVNPNELVAGVSLTTQFCKWRLSQVYSWIYSSWV